MQYAFLRTIPGLEDVRIMRPGYAIEYDCLDPTQLTPSLETKAISGLFSAGQSNGTSGYEEAAAQGLMAGINAPPQRYEKKREALILTRSEAYIGVLIDDLVTKGTEEPYRMMTSRSEYRLILRQDNADLRLTQKGYDIGLVTQERYDAFIEKKEAVEAGLEALKALPVTPTKENQEKLASIGTAPVRTGLKAYDLLRRNEVTYHTLSQVFPLPQLADDVCEEIEIMVKYEGYINRQLEQVEKMNRLVREVFDAGRYRIRRHRYPVGRSAAEAGRHTAPLLRAGQPHFRRIAGRHYGPAHRAGTTPAGGKPCLETNSSRRRRTLAWP